MVWIYIWYLITAPTDRIVCQLWTSKQPDQAAITAACGRDIYNNLQRYRLRLVMLDTNQVACERPGEDLEADLVSLCPLGAPLDNFRLLLVQPDWVELKCSIFIDRPGEPPTGTEINHQCGGVNYLTWFRGELELKSMGSKQRKPAHVAKQICPMPIIPPGNGLFERPDDPVDLATSSQYTWLAGRLIWWGYVPVDCDGWSGVDPNTLAATPCGMDAALNRTILWQNQFDQDIYTEAEKYHIPPRLLKEMIGVESQFWPLWSPPGGEIGVMQVTDNGLDVLMRYDPEAAMQICPMAILDCSSNYAALSQSKQAAIRLAMAAQLRCMLCGPNQAAAKIRSEIPIYARMLRAYYCYAGAVSPEYTPRWEAAIVLYHAGPGCLMIACQDGIKYLRRISV